MVDIALITTVLAVVLGGIALVVLGAIGYIANQAVQDRLDDRAGVPRPGAPAPAPQAAAPGRAERPREPVAGPTAA
ncbi:MULTISPECIES: hypothetical protein [Nocardiopsis]|uniref:hypothetical protein n=1 Tax=Nocardiopsis TaxID=2013 RepID=UPI00034888B9|nr:MULTISPECIES: hypothetical protein [Nocardiopsis]